MLSSEEIALLDTHEPKGDPRRLTPEGRFMAKDVEYGFEETFDAAIGRFFDEDLSISAFFASRNAPSGMGFVGNLYEERNQKLREMRDSGEITPEVWDYYSSPERLFGNKDVYWDKLAKYVQKEHGRVDVETDKQLKSRVREELAKRREYAARVFARGDIAGSLLGTIHAAVLDPINVATALATPIAAARSGKIIHSALKYGAYEAGLSAAAELPIQIQVRRFKEDIDSPYTGTEMLYNILAAMAGGAAIGSLVGGVSAGLARRTSIKDVEQGISDMVRTVYHGTDAKFETIDTKGLGAHLAVKPGTAARYVYTQGGQVYELELAGKNFLRVPDTGTDHRVASDVIHTFIKDGVLPEDFAKGLDVRLREGLTEVERLRMDYLEGRVDEDDIIGRLNDGNLKDDDVDYILAEPGSFEDLPVKFQENNLAELERIKKHFQEQGYEGLVYEGSAGGAGTGEVYIAFEPQQAAITRPLTKEQARALDENAQDLKPYRDELRRSPETTVHDHESKIEAQVRELNDDAPIRQPDEPESLEDMDLDADINSRYAALEDDIDIMDDEGVRRPASELIKQVDEQTSLIDKVLRCMRRG